MKRIIYGSLSVLTAIGTVFVAAKADVMGGDRAQTRATKETVESTELNALSSTSKTRLPSAAQTNTLSLENSLENGLTTTAQKGEAATFGAANASSGLFGNSLLGNSATKSNLSLTPKA
ncbi:MAG: hypothetical protein AAFZ17_15525, partial [Cyanobacteria bacterium J06650_10]